jgi:predicted MFS family arabinose efflux permease
LKRRSVMIFADLVRFFIVLAMLFVRSAGHVWTIYVLLFLETVMWALFEPGRSAVIPNITKPGEEVLAANSLSSMTWSINLAVGAGLGGVVAWKFGRDFVFALNAVSFLVSASLLRAMRLHEPHAAGGAPLHWKEVVDFSPMWEGMRYVARDGKLLATLLVKTGMGLLGAHWVILPVMGERIFKVDDSGTLGMSLLLGSRGVGALLGSLVSVAWARNNEKRMRQGILFGFLLMAFSYMTLGGASQLTIACLAVMFGHAGTSTAWVFSTTMLQQMTEDRYRGRVFSADFAGLFLLMSTVSYIAGLFVDAGTPVRTVAVVTGLMGLIPAGLWFYARKRLWRE